MRAELASRGLGAMAPAPAYRALVSGPWRQASRERDVSQQAPAGGLPFSGRTASYCLLTRASVSRAMRISSSVVTTQILMGESSIEMMRFTPMAPST